MLQKNKKGFTLIELMVVIAIIALLAAVVLVSLQAARERAEDSNRTAAVTQIRSLAETYFARDLHYGVLADAPDGPDELTVLYEEYGYVGDDVLNVHVATGDEPQEYCAEIELKENEGEADAAFFCVDHDLRAIKHLDGSRRCTDTSLSCEATP